MHPEGMLDRDQRTAKLRLYVSDEVPKSLNNYCECSSYDRSSNSSSINSSYRKRKSSNLMYLSLKRGYLIHSFQRLKKVLLVLVYLTIITLPTSNSAPTNIRMSSRLKEHPKWMNPCGIISHQDATDFEGNGQGLKDSDLRTYIFQIVQQAQIALNRANNFKEKFAHKTFNRNFDDLFKDQSYEWLVTLPKSLGETVASDHLRNLKLEETFLDVYGYLQMVAVGMEQVVWDQQDRPGFFPNDFKEQENNLVLVLCELQMAMTEMNIGMRPDITRDIMGDEFRLDMDTTQINARDFIIFREYINNLEYVIQVFSHLANKL